MENRNGAHSSTAAVDRKGAGPGNRIVSVKVTGLK